MKRKIIKIDEEKCNGCGICASACAEGAIEIIGGKAKLVKDEYCDGLGACIGECPEDAIKISEREAKDFDEEAVKKHLSKPQDASCPGSKPRDLTAQTSNSQLKNWPIQLKLVPVNAGYFDKADLLLSADCAPYCQADFHESILKGKTLIIACPKLDDTDFFVEKMTEILKNNDIKRLTVAHMEVPCCSGLIFVAKKAIEASGKDIPLKIIKLTIKN